MRISVEARAGTTSRDAQARVVIDGPPPVPSADQARGRIANVVASTVGTIVAIAGAITSLPELSARLPARAVIALHFIAMVGTSAQPLVVGFVAAVVTAIADRRSRRSVSPPER